MSRSVYVIASEPGPMTFHVYRPYDVDGVLLYIGQTQNVAARVRWHRQCSHAAWSAG